MVRYESGRRSVEMKRNRLIRMAAIILILSACVFLLGYCLAGGFAGEKGEGLGGLFLTKPALAAEGTTFLEQEAGMSLYFNAGQTLNLSTAKSVYKTVESETATYLIGSISLPGLPETDDVHCYVQKDGWIVVYYLKAEPVSKIIDWNYYTSGQLTSNKLKTGMGEMCTALGITPTDAKYYHFQYSYASKWMIVTESVVNNGSDSFNLNIPSSFSVYERSWSHRNGAGKTTKCGSLTQTQLAPDIAHVVEAYVESSYYTFLKIDGTQIDRTDGSVTSEIAIVLVYREA
jgi:hypothetical protein